MKFINTLALLIIFAATQFPCAGYAAEEDRELALIAAEQKKSDGDEKLDEINPALTDTITTKPTQESDKEIKERKKKLKQTRKEKEKDNKRKLKESSAQKNKPRRDDTIIIEPTPKLKSQPVTKPEPTPQPVIKPEPKPQPITKPEPPTQPVNKPEPSFSPPSVVETVNLPDQKIIYSNFVEVARAVHFVPLYVPRKSGYEITAIYSNQGVVEVRYGRRWEPKISLTIRTHKRAVGEELQDISGVSDVKWRVDNTTGTTVYIAKISETQQVAAWAVGQYTFSAQSENLSFAGFHSLVTDELVELSMHYYTDI